MVNSLWELPNTRFGPVNCSTRVLDILNITTVTERGKQRKYWQLFYIASNLTLPNVLPVRAPAM